MEEMASLGIAGALVLLILDRVVSIIKQARIKEAIIPSLASCRFTQAHSAEIFRAGKQGDEIHEVHLGKMAMDKNNDPKWYATSELQTDRHNEIVTVLKELVVVNKEIAKSLKK